MLTINLDELRANELKTTAMMTRIVAWNSTGDRVTAIIAGGNPSIAAARFILHENSQGGPHV